MNRAILLEINLFTLNQKIYVLDEKGRVIKQDAVPNETVAGTIYSFFKVNHTRTLKIHGNRLYAQRFLKALEKNYTTNIKVQYI